MANLRVILDQLVAPVPGGIGRYAEELTRQLIATAPVGVGVEGVVSASPESDYARIAERLPGLAGLYKSALARRELSLAWQLGFPLLPGGGMVHAMSLLAPLGRHDRLNSSDQVAVTIHDVVPWSHPETLTARGVSWHRAMARRAERFADAIVVPTHAVAEQLAGVLDVGERIRVIGGAVSDRLAVPADADERAEALALPDSYLLAVGTLEPRKGLSALLAALADPRTRDLPLLVVGQAGWGAVDLDAAIAGAGVHPDRVRVLGRLADEDLAVALDKATVFVFPSLAEGFGLPVLEAFSLGTPVVHSDDPAVLEVSAGAGIAVARDDAAGYPARLADAIGRLLDDRELAARHGVLGADRARAYSWRTSAEQVWQLHADL